MADEVSGIRVRLFQNAGLWRVSHSLSPLVSLSAGAGACPLETRRLLEGLWTVPEDFGGEGKRAAPGSLRCRRRVRLRDRPRDRPVGVLVEIERVGAGAGDVRDKDILLRNSVACIDADERTLFRLWGPLPQCTRVERP